MMEKWRFLNLGTVDHVSYWTYPEAVMKAKSEGGMPNAIVFSTPQDKMVSVGYYQDADKEVNLPLCKEMNIDVARRYGFGGGTLLYDQNSFLFHIIVDSDRFPKDYPELMMANAPVLLKSLEKLGINAKFFPINDVLTASGKKIGMMSTFRTDYPNITYITCSLHRDVDVELAMQVITPPAEKFKDKAAKTVRDRISTVTQELGYTLPSNKHLAAVLSGMEEGYGMVLEDDQLNEHEKNIYKECYQNNSKDDFLKRCNESYIFKDELPLVNQGQLVRSEFRYKGSKLIRVVVLLEGKMIRRVGISGDYYAYPWHLTDAMEKALEGTPATNESIKSCVYDTFEKENGETAMITPDEFVSTIFTAVKDAE